MPKKRTLKQNRIIHSLLTKRGFAADDKAQLVYDITKGRTESTKEMYESEADVMITRLGGKVSSFTSRRTVNYRKQKAGIATVVSQKHLAEMKRLWFLKPHRTKAGLEAMCNRIFKNKRPRTAQECSKIIEAIKSMNSRDNAKPQTATGTKEAA